MEFNNKVLMSINDWHNYKDDEDAEFAFGRIEFLSNRPNSHKHVYSEEVIKEYAPTVLGKWVVCEYDKYAQDATTHTNDQKIVGYISPTQEVQFNYDSDGYLVASVNVMLSKIYATEVYEMFKKDNYRSVSIEEMVAFTPETQDLVDGKSEKIITGFNICGITILGKKVNPSVPLAHMTLTKMSEKEYNDTYVKYAQKNKIGNLWSCNMQNPYS